MKKLLVLFITTLSLISNAQNLETKKTYHDPYARAHLNEVYTVIAGTATKHGLYKAYDYEGVLVKEKTYANGVANGPYKEYYSSQYNLNERGKLGLIENYKNGKLDGTSEEYVYPNGKKLTTKTLTYKMGELLKEVHYYETGQKGTERDHVTGAYTEWYENGQKKEAGTYDSYGYKAGSYTKWYEDGQVMELKQDSAGVTLHMEYREKGGKTYAVDLGPTGYVSTTIDPSGAKIEEAQSKPSGGTPPFYYDGKYTEYYATGEVKQTGTYSGNKQVGQWTTYDKEGKVLSSESK